MDAYFMPDAFCGLFTHPHAVKVEKGSETGKRWRAVGRTGLIKGPGLSARIAALRLQLQPGPLQAPLPSDGPRKSSGRQTYERRIT